MTTLTARRASTIAEPAPPSEDDVTTETVAHIFRGSQVGLTPDGEVLVSVYDELGRRHDIALEFASEEVQLDVLHTMLAAWGNHLAADASRRR